MSVYTDDDSEWETGEEDFEDDSRSMTSVDSFEEDLVNLRSVVGSLTDAIEELESHLSTLQRPMEHLLLNQLDNVPFLNTSPFRSTKFKIRRAGIPGLDAHQTYEFSTICEKVRAYLQAANCISDDGTIELNSKQQKLFDIQESQCTYFDILAKLTHYL